MIYGKLSLEDWRNISVEGEVPESSFENHNLRLFFYGTLYNRDVLQANFDDTNAKLVASIYLQNGESGFSHLDGSFTIVFYSKEQCGIVRDHHGTHFPVYYAKSGEFANSLNFFSDHFGIPCQLDKSSLSCFLQSGLMRKSHSAFHDIFRLEAGQIAITNNKHISCISPFLYEINPGLEKRSDVELYSQQYGELHVKAIRRRIGDSQRVGILLSGGYDSGANLAALRSIYDGEINSYSVGFKGDNWTELPLARIMSKAFGTRHHEYEIDGTEINALPKIVDYLGEPFVEGGLMVNYCAMRMIGEDKPEVILGGDGSDQYFGTSGREVALHYLAARTGMRPIMKGVYGLLDRDAFDKDGKLFRIHFHLDKILNILDGDRFGFPNFRMRELLKYPKDFQLTSRIKPDIGSFERLYAQHGLFSDIETVINHVILYKASRMAQMFGNNLTFPYMDLTLYHFLQELPVQLKCKGESVLDIARGRGTAKYLLKHHYKSLLPEAITSKKKQGGFAPMPLFFRDSVQRARLKEFILSSAIVDEFLNKDAVERFLTKYDREALQEGSWFWYRQNCALQYFNMLTLAVWWEQFVEKKEVKF